MNDDDDDRQPYSTNIIIHEQKHQKKHLILYKNQNNVNGNRRKVKLKNHKSTKRRWRR